MRHLNGQAPATVSPLLVRSIGQLSKNAGVPSDRLAQAVAELSRLFTRERTGLGRTYLDDPVYGAAYLNYFLPVNLSKIQILLNEMPDGQAGGCFSVLDLGSGPGTGALAVLDWWHGQKRGGMLSVRALDNVPRGLCQAEQLWGQYCREARVTGASLQTYKGNLERDSWLGEIRHRRLFDLIILANCLNEVHANAKDPIAARTGLLTNLLSLLAPHGTMMIVEPALRETSRALHAVRDRLLQTGSCTVYSPCLHDNDCPALVHPDDWCHEERGWEAPAMIQEIDEEAGFIKDALKFSYLLLRKDGKTIVERRPDVYRVVSELREMKGEKRAWLCNELGRPEVGRLDRMESPQNAGVDDWHRGAIVQIERIVRKERDGKVSALGRIDRDAEVRIIRPV